MKDMCTSETMFKFFREELKHKQRLEEERKRNISAMSDDQIKKELIDYDELLNIWADKVIEKADESEKLKQEINDLEDIRYTRLVGYIEGLYMALSLLNSCEKKAIKKIREEE